MVMSSALSSSGSDSGRGAGAGLEAGALAAVGRRLRSRSMALSTPRMRAVAMRKSESVSDSLESIASVLAASDTPSTVRSTTSKVVADASQEYYALFHIGQYPENS